MKCEHCGNNLENGAMFCIYCGAKVEPKGNSNYYQKKSININIPNKIPKVKKPNKKYKPFIKVGLAIVAFLVLVFGLRMVFAARKTVDLSKYYDVEITGADGYGTASINYKNELNSLELYLELISKSNIKSSTKKKLKEIYNSEMNTSVGYDYYDEYYAYDRFCNSLDYTEQLELAEKFACAAHFLDADEIYSLNKSENLKNGDVVKAELNKSSVKAWAETLGIHIKDSKIKKKVKGLKEVTKYDPFQHVHVKFDGVIPSVSVQVVLDNEEKVLTADDFEIYAGSQDYYGNYSLKEGDTVKVVLNDSDEMNKRLLEQGYVIEGDEHSKEFACVTKTTDPTFGADYYYTDFNQISKEYVEDMKKSCIDAIEAHIADLQGYGTCKKSEIQYVGNYMLSEKSEGDHNHNELYLIFSCNLEDTVGERAFTNTEVYFPIRFDNIQTKDGSSYTEDFSTVTKDSIFGETDLVTGQSWYRDCVVKGYEASKANIMKNDLVTKYLDIYTLGEGSFN